MVGYDWPENKDIMLNDKNYSLVDSSMLRLHWLKLSWAAALSLKIKGFDLKLLYACGIS